MSLFLRSVVSSSFVAWINTPSARSSVLSDSSFVSSDCIFAYFFSSLSLSYFALDWKSFSMPFALF
jgi:hypothetical protein